MAELNRPLDLATKVPNERPSKLSAILSGFNECYVAILALMQMTNTPEAQINFDRNHDEFVQQSPDYFCSTGIIDDVQRYYEAHWMHIPTLGRDWKYAVHFWNEVLRPTLVTAATYRTGNYRGTESITPSDYLALGVYSYDHLHWTSYTEVYMSKDEIAADILKAADYLQINLENLILQDYYPQIRLYDINEAVAGPHPEKAIKLEYPYFRINMIHQILTNPDPTLRWAVFRPNHATEDIKVALLRNEPNRKVDFAVCSKFFETDKRCGWYDTEIGVFTVKEMKDVETILKVLNRRIDNEK